MAPFPAAESLPPITQLRRLGSLGNADGRRLGHRRGRPGGRGVTLASGAGPGLEGALASRRAASSAAPGGPAACQ